MRMDISCKIGFLLVAFAFVPAASAQGQSVIYVNQAASGANDGTTWADAYTSLQDALNATPRGSGDEIWVAQSIYRPDQGQAVTEGDREASFRLKSNVALYGGFVGTETSRDERDWLVNPTLLSGDLLGNDNDNVDINEPSRADNSYHVVTATDLDPWTVLDGFTITGGNASDQNAPFGRGLLGGGLMLDYLAHPFEAVQPRFAHLVFEANAAGFRGGGVYLRIRGVDFEYVTFRSNAAPEGGGVYHDGSIATMRNVFFVGNRAGVGGAMTVGGGEIHLRGVTLRGNVAQSWAGGIYLHLAISLAIFMLLPWPVSHVLRGKALPERPSGIPYRGEGMVLIAIAVFFASVAARVVGLPKRSNEAEMAVFHLVGAMVLP